MRWLLATFALLLSSCDVHGKMEEKCNSDCGSYGAVFVRVTRTTIQESPDSFECWCRRGTEPLRIW
jgi:hypothetical protein